MTKDELLAKGSRAQSAWDEFIGPALESARADYMEALTRVAANEPWQSDKIVKLAMATRVIDLVGSHIQSIVTNGAVEARRADHARQIEDLPAVKRRWLQF